MQTFACSYKLYFKALLDYALFNLRLKNHVLKAIFCQKYGKNIIFVLKIKAKVLILTFCASFHA